MTYIGGLTEMLQISNLKPVVYKKFMPYIEFSWIIYFPAPESGPHANTVTQIN